MKQTNQINRTRIRLSKNKNVLFIAQGDNQVCVGTNFVKHVLQVPYQKNNGEFKSEFDVEATEQESENTEPSYFELQMQKLAYNQSAQAQ